MCSFKKPDYCKRTKGYDLEDIINKMGEICLNCKNHENYISGNLTLVKCKKDGRTLVVILDNEDRLKDGKWSYELNTSYDKMCKIGLEMKK